MARFHWYTLWCSSQTIFLYLLPYWLEFQFIPFFLITVLLNVSTVFIGSQISDRPQENRQTLLKNGYTDFHLFIFFSFTVIIGYLVPFFVLKWLIPVFPVIHFDLPYWLGIIVNFALGEVLFTIAHRQLHSNSFLSKIHHAHHCCVNTCFYTNYAFHPIDLILEFSLPVTVPLVIFFLVYPSQWLLYSFMILMTLWYGLDHDEYLALPHYYHHKYIESNYCVYIKLNDKHVQDKVKHIVKRK
jgi:sterol desaturase/sphingolipid hydroxylase (fatty acid hydroxylase superfamily)